jgi:diguanylate cyclase (GGDEF)-like protein/PAS domain S-box-containing protein
MAQAVSIRQNRTFAYVALLLAGLALVSRVNFVVFRAFTELFSVIAACGIFVVTLNARRYIQNNYILFVGVALLFVGLFDFMNAVSYQGMVFSAGADVNLQGQFRISARILESISFVLAPLLLRRKFTYQLVVAGGALGSFLLLGLIFLGFFPPCSNSGGELTSFMRMSEHAVFLLLLTALGLLLTKRSFFDNQVLHLLLTAVALAACSELLFTVSPWSAGTTDPPGNLLKVAEFYLLYEAVLVTCLARPYDALFRGLRQDGGSLDTEHELAAAALAAGEILVLATDPHGRILSVNRGCERITGYSLAEMRGKSFWELLAPDEAQRVQGIFARIESGVPFGKSENRWVTKGGNERLLVWSARAVPLGEAANRRVIITGNDVTAGKETDGEARFKSLILDNAADPVFVYAEDGRIAYVNKAACSSTGFTEQELRAMPVQELDAPEHRELVRHRTDLLLMTGRAKFETVHLRKDRTGVPVEVSASKAVIEGRNLVTSTVRDISVRKMYQKSLRDRYNELAMLYRISATISETLNVEELFEKILDAIAEVKLLDVERRGGIFLVTGKQMRLVSHLREAETVPCFDEELQAGDCLCGLAARRGDIVVTRNVLLDRRYRWQPGGGAPASHVAIPLKAKNRLVGVMSLYLAAGSRIDEPNMQLLLSIGNQLGVALENARLYEEMRALALHDPLTGFANRRLMEIVFERSCAEARRYGECFSVIMLDVDYFKKYNDTYGHAAGDDLLVRFAGIIKEETRDIDFVVRYGGEEFLIILPETGLDEAFRAANRLRETIALKAGVTASFGVAVFSPEIGNKEELIVRADAALYLAKHKGRNRVEMAV